MSEFNIKKDKCKEFEPTERVISEGDILIKNLVKKQLQKNINLKDQLSLQIPFTQKYELIDTLATTSGLLNINEFTKHSDSIDNLEKLNSYGLSKEEIELFSDYQKGEEYLYTKHKNISKDILAEKLNYILSVIENSEINTIKKSNSRLIEEISLSTKPESEETKLLKFALNCESTKQDNTPINHPINSLKEIAKELFATLNKESITIPSLKKRRRKAKKILDSEQNNFDITREEIMDNKNRKTKWDVKENESGLKPTKIRKTYKCEAFENSQINKIEPNIKIKKKFIRSKHFFGWKTDTNFLESHDFKKISEDEIKSIPRFQKYERGSPSKILYIKNLAKGTSEEDLVKLFSSFDNEEKRISYRLMTGKMRGQAFITFQSVDQATKALELMNGCIFRDKPIIIQYGKKDI